MTDTFTLQSVEDGFDEDEEYNNQELLKRVINSLYEEMWRYLLNRGYDITDGSWVHRLTVSNPNDALPDVYSHGSLEIRLEVSKKKLLHAMSPLIANIIGELNQLDNLLKQTPDITKNSNLIEKFFEQKIQPFVFKICDKLQHKIISEKYIRINAAMKHSIGGNEL